MRDEYPPFRIDQGGSDEPLAEAAPAVPHADGAPGAPARGRGTAGRVVLTVVGVLAGVLAFGLLAGGCALVAIDQTQRDDDGFLMSPSENFSTLSYAVVSERADIDTDGAEWALDTLLGTVRIRSESERSVFVGVAPAADVDRYLEGVEHDVVTDLDSTGDPKYARRPGSAPAAAPTTETFWAESAAGTGEQAVDWEPEDGDWRVVLMNDDGSRGVSADVSIGAELDTVLWIGIGLLVVGGLVAAAAALAITAGTRRRAA
jgi:hypothetical protein